LVSAAIARLCRSMQVKEPVPSSTVKEPPRLEPYCLPPLRHEPSPLRQPQTRHPFRHRRFHGIHRLVDLSGPASYRELIKALCVANTPGR
jgi:hypothetical protein